MIVIAVDTIAHKLISEGIEPTFICSIERVHEVFEYFYADVEIPEKSIIVGPPVLDNRVFEISNEIIIPFREGISETSWLQKLLGLSSETAIPMGYSCANVAFSLGHYLGCNPIILVGQDLAYGNSEEETHAYGTKYDVLDEEINKTDDIEFTTGYYGKTVKTTKIWLQFKHWLENEINNLPITVINATEGGAKINFAKQLTLSDAVDTYCQIDIPDVNREIQKVPRYTIDKEYYLANLAGEINLYEEIKNKSGKYRKILSSITIGNNINSLLKLSEDFQLFIEGIIKQPLLLHNLQSVVMQYYWAYNGRLQIMDQEYIKQEIIEQQKLLGTIVEVIERILTILKAQLKHK
ncbi:hypothetical protein C3943_04055 [Lysinibacillus sp. B2A1]|nr:hypothetical protein C3943_04055 [Lysinibacillus sp. B2A1]